MTASVDVVLATYNRQARLVRTLESLARQVDTEFGVVVVDDGSTPPAIGAVPASLLSRLRLTSLRTPGNQGPAAARNLALRHSAADVVAFIDDDVDADPSWLAAHRNRLDSHGHSTVSIGPLLAPRDWRPTAWNRWEAAKLAHEYQRMSAGVYEPTWRQFFTGNAAARRGLLMEAGGFDESLRRAEDIEFGLRLSRVGARFVFAPEAKGWHYAHRSPGAWLSNAEQYALIDVDLDRRYPELGWLAMIREELSRRSCAAQILRHAAVGLMGHGRATSAALTTARLLNQGPLVGASVRAASLAYDIRYRLALESAAGALPEGTKG